MSNKVIHYVKKTVTDLFNDPDAIRSIRHWASSGLGSVGFIQNGNSFGAGAVLGTNDANSLSLKTNNQVYTILSNTGRLTHMRADTLETLDSGGFQEDAFFLSDRRFQVNNNVTSTFVAPALRANGIGFSDLNWTTPNNAVSSLGAYEFSSLRTKVGLTNNNLTFGSNVNTAYTGSLINFEITNYNGLTSTGYMAGIKTVLSRSGTTGGTFANFSDILVGASNGQGDGSGIVITTRRAVHIMDYNTIWPTSITNKWGVFQEGTTIFNAYAGNSSFGSLSAATAKVHLGAGTTAANSAPIKFTSGTNTTTAEAGTIEYNGTNFFATRTGTTRENILIAVDNASAPSTTAAGTVTNRYGNATNFLGDPNRWISVNILGTVYKIPMYT